MPSFDVVSEVDNHELKNAIDQASRVVETRFDFKGIEATFELKDKEIVLTSEADFQIEQMKDMLEGCLIKRSIDPRSVEWQEQSQTGKRVKCGGLVRQGLETDNARKLIKMIKEKKLKVQTQLQGDQLRVTGKKRDDLQEVIALLKEANFEQPLQYNNFRD